MSQQGYVSTAAPQAAARLADHTTQISNDALVENRLTGLLSSDNAYMQQAETRGLQQANARGLLSSSMAVGAVEGQRISAALPIAQQDASLYGQANLQDSAYIQQGNLNTQNYSNNLGTLSHQGNVQSGLQYQQGDINSRLQNEQGTINSRLQSEQGNINSRLQSEQGQITHGLNAQMGGINMGLQAQQGNINSRLQGEQGAISQTLNAQQGSINSQLQRETADMNSRAQLQTNISNINNNPNLSVAQRQAAIQNETNVYNAISGINTAGTQMAGSTFIYSNQTRLPGAPQTRPTMPGASASSGGTASSSGQYTAPAPPNYGPNYQTVGSAGARYAPPAGKKWIPISGGAYRLVNA